MRTSNRHWLARPLCHPAFVVALLTLALNDHVLKLAHVLPGWLTGKLSDVAGLIVGPIVAAELCLGRLRTWRPWAAGLVVVGFVVCKLSAASAASLDALLAQLGLPSQLVADPSDLLALAVLPLTIHVLRGSSERSALWPWWERVVLVCAAGLCVATTSIKPFRLGPYLVNHSGAALTLQLRWLPADAACTATPDELRALTRKQAAAPTHRVALGPAQVADLSWEPRTAADSVVGRCPDYADLDPFGDGTDGGTDADAAVSSNPPTPCVAVELLGAGLPHVVVRAPRSWSNRDHGTSCRQPLPVYEDPGDGAVELMHGDGRAQLRGYKNIEIIAAD